MRPEKLNLRRIESAVEFGKKESREMGKELYSLSQWLSSPTLRMSTGTVNATVVMSRKKTLAVYVCVCVDVNEIESSIRENSSRTLFFFCAKFTSLSLSLFSFTSKQNVNSKWTPVKENTGARKTSAGGEKIKKEMPRNFFFYSPRMTSLSAEFLWVHECVTVAVVVSVFSK